MDSNFRNIAFCSVCAFVFAASMDSTGTLKDNIPFLSAVFGILFLLFFLAASDAKMERKTTARLLIAGLSAIPVPMFRLAGYFGLERYYFLLLLITILGSFYGFDRVNNQ